MKLLFLSTRRAKPSFRFRVEQFLPVFAERGHRCDVEFLRGQLLSRWGLYRRLPQYDVVFLQKRLLSRAELFLVRRQARRLVYDVDDAVMFDGQGRPDRRRQSRFRAMAGAADLMICGNSYLAEQSRKFSPRVEIVPTSIDTRKYQRNSRNTNSEPVVIGWTGSRSTNGYLNAVLPEVAALDGQVCFKFISDTSDGVNLALLGAVPFQFVPWSPDVEIAETATFDIGLMPLPDNPWTRGKCGFKALQYMGLGIAAVCSPVGVNCDIITHNENGLLAASPAQWRDCLARLVRDPDFRSRLGTAGRSHIEQHFAIDIQAPRLVGLLEELNQAQPQTA